MPKRQSKEEARNPSLDSFNHPEERKSTDYLLASYMKKADVPYIVHLSEESNI